MTEPITDTATAADAEVPVETHMDGATPPVKAESSAKPDPSTPDGARAILRAASGKPPAEKNPLLDMDSSNPLLGMDDGNPLHIEDSEEEETPPEEIEQPAEEKEPPSAEETKPPEPAAQEKARKRLTITRRDPETGDFVYSERDRRILTLIADDMVSPEEAVRIVNSESPVPKVEAEQPKTAEPAKPQATEAEIEQQIATLRTQRREAKALFDAEKESDLTDQIEDLIAQKGVARETAKAEQQAQSESQRAYETSFNAAVANAIDMYEDAGKPGTPLYNAIAQESAEMKARNDPFLNNPKWPTACAVLKATELGIAPKAKAPAAAKAPVKPVPAVASKPSRPVPSPSSGGVASHQAANPRAELAATLEAAQKAGDAKAAREATRQIYALAGRRAA